MSERLDKLVASVFDISRREAKESIRAGLVTVDGAEVRDPEQKVEAAARLALGGTAADGGQKIYIMMNKPSGILCASRDASRETVVDLVPQGLKRKDLFPVGRLDKDTTGLLLITNDGDWAHRIVSPAHHVAKTYTVTLDGAVTDEAVKGFSEGVRLADGELCKPALLEPTESAHIARVTLREGKYHQIKRMFGVYGLGVDALHRESVGNLLLDGSLGSGECRVLKADEILAAEEK